MEDLGMTLEFQYAGPAGSFWSGKRVLITGHTGFKGSWLSLWLTRLGSVVCGIGLDSYSNPSLFQSASVGQRIASNNFLDIRDLKSLSAKISEFKPEIVFHLAAQALVLESYVDPMYTYQVNTLGTCNILNALLDCESLRAAVFVTTDKVYENPENSIPFKETDPLGGHDPYSASKAACEILISSYRRSYFHSRGVGVASARAGNVIGGGDWSKHRLIPDAIRSWGVGQPIKVRHPHAIRPWQHVLDPLAGYLCLAERLWFDLALADSYNFGPMLGDTASVARTLEIAQELYGDGTIEIVENFEKSHEAMNLRLDISRAASRLGFRPKWSLIDSIDYTIDWYRRFRDGIDPYVLCVEDFHRYTLDSSRARKTS